MKNNNQKDILADILGSVQEGRIRGVDELTKLTHISDVKDDPFLEVLPKRTAGKTKKKKKPKRKSTHYLNEEVFANLGEAKIVIKELLPEGLKTKVTKSRIVENAIKVLLDEFEKKGDKSYLVKQLLEKK